MQHDIGVLQVSDGEFHNRSKGSVKKLGWQYFELNWIEGFLLTL